VRISPKGQAHKKTGSGKRAVNVNSIRNVEEPKKFAGIKNMYLRQALGYGE